MNTRAGMRRHVYPVRLSSIISGTNESLGKAAAAQSVTLDANTGRNMTMVNQNGNRQLTETAAETSNDQGRESNVGSHTTIKTPMCSETTSRLPLLNLPESQP